MMRISRVDATTSSIFRNSKQYLHSNELFHRAMSEGKGNPFNEQARGLKKKQLGSLNKQGSQKHILNKSVQRFILKDSQYDADTVTTMQNSLLDHSLKITLAQNQKTRLHTYRTSI